MKQKDIRVQVSLDEKSRPCEILWHADDGQGEMATPAMHMAVWDQKAKDALLLNLWTDKMPVKEMKYFCLHILQRMSQSLLEATGDEKMVSDMTHFCEELKRKHLNGKEDEEQV